MEIPPALHPSTASPVNMIINDDDDEDVCRICRSPGDSDNPLRYPCACSGTIKYVHQECLLQWLNYSNARRCEVCKHPFAFSPVYADNAPSRLPFPELIPALGIKACHVLHVFMRLSFILSVWLLIIPFVTFWIWRMSFVTSFAQAQRLLITRFSTTVILTDCLYGSLLSAAIAYIFLRATSLRDYFRHLQRNGARVAPPRQEIAGAGGMILRIAENVVARWEMEAARLQAHVEHMFDRLEDVPFGVLVGMQRPVFRLVENAFTVIASNMKFIGVIIFVPFSLGRVIQCYLSFVFSVVPLTESALSLANMTLESLLSVFGNLTSETQKNAVLGQVAEMLSGNATSLNGTSDLTSRMLTEFLKGQFIGDSRLSDVTTLAFGYLFIFDMVIYYLLLVAFIRYSRGEPLTMGRLYSLSFIAEAVPSLFRRFILVTRHLMTMAMVASLLIFEFVDFPLLCGWWLDVCTIRMFGKSSVQRVEFFSHWVIGILYMWQICIFLRLLRGVLRPGTLHFLRDPAHPNYNLFRSMIHDPLYKHARRVFLSVAVYGSLIVMLVLLPAKLAMRMSPSIFPLDIYISDPFTEIPAHMLLFHMCIPFAIEHFKLGTTIKSLLRYWFTVVGGALGLTEFLLPRPEDNGGQQNGNGDPGRQDRVHRRQDVDRGFGGLAADVNRARHENDDQVEVDRCSFVIRIVLLLLAAWMTLLMFNCFLIVVPISLGRALFNYIPFLNKCNDVYAFVIGSYVTWIIIAGVRYCIDHIRTRNVKLLLKEIWKWGGIVLKSSVMLSIWILVIPVLIGLLLKLLVIVPLLVPVDESPVFLLDHDWALGLIFLKIWSRLVMLDHMRPLVGNSWRVKFERVREDGFSRLQGFWILREIVLPIIIKLLIALCVPYVLSRGVFPVFGYPLIVNSAVNRFAWLGCLGFSSVWYCAKRFHVWLVNLHNSIRDDRYMIGRRLRDFGEER